MGRLGNNEELRSSRRGRGGPGRQSPLRAWLHKNRQRVQRWIDQGFFWDDVAREASKDGVEQAPGQAYPAKRLANLWSTFRKRGLLSATASRPPAPPEIWTTPQSRPVPLPDPGRSNSASKSERPNQPSQSAGGSLLPDRDAESLRRKMGIPPE